MTAHTRMLDGTAAPPPSRLRVSTDLGRVAIRPMLRNFRVDIFGAIADEHRRTVDWHGRITGSATLLADNPLLARSLNNRYPYLDPLHVMQVDLLRRFRDGDRDEMVERGILLSINAIATGLRNSG